MPAYSISSRLPLDEAFGDEGSFRVYREEEAHPATEFLFSRHLSACSMEGAVICCRWVRAPSPISAVTLIIFVLLSSCEVLEPDMLTLEVPLSREVGDGFTN
jgi:hypothetical protein